MHDLSYFGGIYTGVVANFRNTIHDTDRRVGRRAGYFGRVNRTRFLIDENQVSERAANVDTQAIRHDGLLL